VSTIQGFLFVCISRFDMFHETIIFDLPCPGDFAWIHGGRVNAANWLKSFIHMSLAELHGVEKPLATKSNV
jgi:hypothetical protein